ncbi:hypothetical protein [Cytobacillus oceanisediminis]|nr:hypothetical protein [Cytobacillus oceanisediminis]MCM3402967.1 hypothetical protein [Cytobacillus oceanisediminis]QOK30031.1 hypothetical protein IIE26_27065 [Cytobacillus oceanisediminis]
MKETKTYIFENANAFQRALENLPNIIACHYHYEYNAGYIVVEKQD